MLVTRSETEPISACLGFQPASPIKGFLTPSFTSDSKYIHFSVSLGSQPK